MTKKIAKKIGKRTPKRTEEHKTNIAETMIGNSNTVKFDTPQKRRQLMKDYFDHRAKGYSGLSFLPCDMRTFKEYCGKFPEDFPAEVINEAERKYMQFWETVGMKGTVGATGYGKFNSQAWKFFMTNNTPWRDSVDINGKVEADMETVAKLEKITQALKKISNAK